MTLTDQQVAQFRNEGVLVAEGVATEGDLAPLTAELEAWVDEKARALHAEGAITDLAEGADFGDRIAKLYAQSPRITEGLDVMFSRGPALFAFLRNGNVLDAVQSLLETPEITCSPIQHLRAKAPASATGEGASFFNVPWHQDQAVTWEEANDSNIITCWLALVDATVENGCMEVIPGVFKNGLLEHKPGEGGPSIPTAAFGPDALPRAVPVKRGGFVFMHRCTPHRSTPNFTHSARWSLDLRYQPTGQPTGRPFHPEFVARSEAHPETVLTDHGVWSRRWVEALEASKGAKVHRV
ncbi:MAG: phytanoyl-CoA dioxygenase family protein [Cytophagales bacterium]|nr:phytanoyl-CoA dioxygenase family protein [Armatimonadota bacterium]